MSEDLAEGDALFTSLCEFGPIVGNRGVQIEAPYLRLPEYAERGDRLAHRIEIDDCVSLPESGVFRIDVVSPDVDDGFAILADRQVGADFMILPDHFHESRTNGSKVRGAIPDDLSYGGMVVAVEVWGLEFVLTREYAYIPPSRKTL